MSSTFVKSLPKQYFSFSLISNSELKEIFDNQYSRAGAFKQVQDVDQP